MKVEICANSFASAKAAQDAGADRIELCTELSVGGLTPSLGLIEKVITTLTVPVHVLIRPRSGNFTYTNEELDVMVRDITFCSEIGCAGIISGALDHHLEIDVPKTTKLINASRGLEFTFHRAFDWVQDPMEQLQKLIELQVDSLLSSGLKLSAIEGITFLSDLKRASEGKLEIVPCGGITLENALHFRNAGFTSVHLSATTKKQTLLKKPPVPMHGPEIYEEGVVATSDTEMIRSLIEILSN